MRRRCLIPASGFYERDAHKTPLYFYPKYGSIFAFAGLWDSWKGMEGERINSCPIITTRANGLLKPLHDRMPAIINSDYYSAWREADAGELSKLLEPYPAALMSCHPVSKRVNSVKGDDELCAAESLATRLSAVLLSSSLFR
jgi:putative SOS response-associated peptidase YedK